MCTCIRIHDTCIRIHVYAYMYTYMYNVCALVSLSVSFTVTTCSQENSTAVLFIELIMCYYKTAALERAVQRSYFVA